MGTSWIRGLDSMAGRRERVWMYDICEISATICAADSGVMYKRNTISQAHFLNYRDRGIA